MELYWLSTEEWTLGFYSSLEKCVEACERFEKQEAIWDEDMPVKFLKIGKGWTCGGYSVHLLTDDSINVDQF